ncbi:MAG: FkbM family methyltransferase [Verrucomicrobiota bacterium]
MSEELLDQRTEFKVHVPDLKHPLYMRLHSSDIAVYDQVFKHLHYEIDTLRPVESIIDAGANIGLTSVYFASRYPSARILALEPEQSNYMLLQKNVGPYENIVPIQGALWNENTKLSIFDSGLDEWGYQTAPISEESGERCIQEVSGWTVEELMQEHDIDFTSLLKIDVEGAEKEVFQEPSEWMNRVGIIAIELHDRIKMGCTRNFYQATRHFQVEQHKGGNVILGLSGWLGAR